MRPYIVPVMMLAGIAWLTSGPSAQGLGSVAKREAERRQQVSGGKKYTNEDLQAAPSVSAPSRRRPRRPLRRRPNGRSPSGTEPKDAAAAPAGRGGEGPFNPAAGRHQDRPRRSAARSSGAARRASCRRSWTRPTHAWTG